MLFFKKARKNAEAEVLDNPVPLHIALIPDGNGRWAQRRGMPRKAGHREGSNTLKRIVIYCSKIGIKYLTVYTFSTENWSRPKEEVDALMGLLLEFLKKAEEELRGSNVRIKVIGDIKGLPEEFHTEIPRVEKLTEKNTGLCLNIALNYGGRDELVHAVRDIAAACKKGSLALTDINEDLISKSIYTAGIPDPDLFIRTSGERRSSNFLIWQLAYTEFWYTDDLWPDFTEKHLIEAVRSFQNRKRRYGGV